MARFGGLGKPVSFGAAEAMIVSTARKDGGIAGSTQDDVLSTIDKLTGGTVTDIQAQLDELRLYLKISIGCSIVAGLFAFANLVKERR